MSTIPAGTYVIDQSHSEVGFNARHAGIAKVRGQFTEYEGALVVGEDLADSSVTVTIQTASIDTNNEGRDGHLRSADFFDVDSNPTMTFTSTALNGTGEDFTVAGDLTLNGITRPVELEVDYNGSAVDPFGNQRVGFEAKTTVNRKDFGLTWNAALETGGFLVSDKIN
ncbi:MAG TPA: YceI family protein, partial [Demequina sp.]|nr:YceI family protein [Demequina sp.]